jgi:hypothetical protein
MLSEVTTFAFQNITIENVHVTNVRMTSAACQLAITMFTWPHPVLGTVEGNMKTFDPKNTHVE